MAMLCAAAMVTGFSTPVWAEADAAADTEAATDDITELTMDMLDEAAYEGTWLSFEPGFDLYVPSNWNVLEISDDDAADGLVFQAQDPDSEEGVNMVVTATDVGTDYDLYSMADELATEYKDVEKVCINGLYGVTFETDTTYGLASWRMQRALCTMFRSDRNLMIFSQLLRHFHLSDQDRRQYS